MWGLTLIGLGLITGVLARVAAPFGILLLAFFYVAQPPFLTSGGAHHFLLLDYNVVEAFALAAVMFNPGAGLWEVAKAVCARLRSRKADSEVSVREPNRRDLIAGLGAIPLLWGDARTCFVLLAQGAVILLILTLLQFQTIPKQNDNQETTHHEQS